MYSIHCIRRINSYIRRKRNEIVYECSYMTENRRSGPSHPSPTPCISGWVSNNTIVFRCSVCRIHSVPALKQNKNFKNYALFDGGRFIPDCRTTPRPVERRRFIFYYFVAIKHFTGCSSAKRCFCCVSADDGWQPAGGFACTGWPETAVYLPRKPMIYIYTYNIWYIFIGAPKYENNNISKRLYCWRLRII